MDQNKWLVCKRSRAHWLGKLWGEKPEQRGSIAPFKTRGGQHPLMTTHELEAFFDQETAGGAAATKSTMAAELLRRQRAALTADGKDPTFAIGPCPKTVGRYMVTMKDFEGASTMLAATEKTEFRFAAEQSMRNALCHASVMAASLLVVGATPGRADSELVRVVSAANQGVPVGPLHPNLICNTDDTSVFAQESEADSAGGWFQVYKTTDRATKGERSIWKPPGEHKTPFTGTRVKLTITGFASGHIGPVFAQVCVRPDWFPAWASERKFIVLRAPGLCPAGASDHRASAIGYIAVTRKDGNNSADTDVFHYHQAHALEPYIAEMRVGVGHVDGHEVPDHLSVVSTFDGGQTQLAAIVAPETQRRHALLKIADCKFAASTSGVAQPEDVSPVHRAIHSLGRKLTGKTQGEAGLKALIISGFKNAGFTVSAGKLSALADFLSCYPSILAAAATPRAITSGFIETGLITSATDATPDLTKLIATCKRQPYAGEMDLVKSSLVGAVREVYRCGQVPEPWLTQQGFEFDKRSGAHAQLVLHMLE